MAGDEEVGAVDDGVGESHPKQRSMESESQYREASPTISLKQSTFTGHVLINHGADQLDCYHEKLEATNQIKVVEELN
ncbi:hypothetical protein QJS04_geneDACA002165 [Acorus gramineus]|uniref:Uncharacterized protein n=1 Tax=Acorus gramineus TaxID=55184 RepID=A0AAV9AAR1_ACOGR|nr:hypothetical protein QJS04_geneDACA002165 [Acorus gramineus]